MGDNSSHESGLGLNVLKLVPQNPRWKSMYAEEAKALARIPHIVEVMHIGSTSLSEVDSKPIVDLAALVDVRPDDSGLSESLVKNGYQDRGEYGLPGRQFFTKGTPPMFHLHVVASREGHWNDWRDFRDYLKKYPEWQIKYQQEKYRIVKETKGDRALYTQEKGAFITMVLNRARTEQGG